MQNVAKAMSLPFDVEATSLINKITSGAGFSQLKAMDWMIWSLILSPFLLRGVLEAKYLKHWMLFVRAVRLITTPAVKRSDVDVANLLFQQFIKNAVDLYGPESIVPNTHGHLHIK